MNEATDTLEDEFRTPDWVRAHVVERIMTEGLAPLHGGEPLRSSKTSSSSLKHPAESTASPSPGATKIIVTVLITSVEPDTSKLETSLCNVPV